MYMDNKDGLNKCNICNKKYSSYKSLWNHNKKFHIIATQIAQNNTQIAQITPIITQNAVIVNSFNCKYCKKHFSRNYNATRHESRCKRHQKEDTVTEITELKKEITELKNLITTKNSNKIINNNIFKFGRTTQEPNNKMNLNSIKMVLNIILKIKIK